MSCLLQRSLLLCLVLLSGCSALPVPAPDPDTPGKGAGEVESVPAPAPLPEAALETPRSPAVTALLAMARDDRAEGRDEQAAVRLERALRIQPRDPLVWLELARIYYDRGEFATAAQFADKAERLAGLDDALRKQAADLLTDARRRGG